MSSSSSNVCPPIKTMTLIDILQTAEPFKWCVRYHEREGIKNEGERDLGREGWRVSKCLNSHQSFTEPCMDKTLHEKQLKLTSDPSIYNNHNLGTRKGRHTAVFKSRMWVSIDYSVLMKSFVQNFFHASEHFKHLNWAIRFYLFINLIVWSVDMLTWNWKGVCL